MILFLNGLRFNTVFLTLILSILIVCSSEAQSKRPFETEDFCRMPNINSKGVSDNGLLAWYTVSPLQYGDSYIVIHFLRTANTDTLHRAKRICVSGNGDWVAYIREPRFEEVRKAKLTDPKAAEKFDDTLVVLLYSGKGSKEYIYPGVKSIFTPSMAGGNYIAALIKPEEDNPIKEDSLSNPTDENETGKNSSRTGNRKKKELKSFRMIVLDPLTGREFIADDAVMAEWSPYGKFLAWVSQPVDTLPIQHLHLFRPDLWKSEPLYLSEGIIKHTAFPENENGFAFLEQGDTSAIKENRVLYCDDLGNLKFRTLIAPENLNFNHHESLYFLRRTNRLITILSYPETVKEEDSLLNEEKYNLDLWSWDDPFLQPQQLKDLDKEKKRGYSAIAINSNDTVSPIETNILRRSNLSRNNTLNLVILWDDQKYAIEGTWKNSVRNDFHLMDLQTGVTRLISEGDDRSMSISPDDSFLVWYDRKDSSWYGMDTYTLSPFCITCGMKTPFYDEQYDNPGTAPSYGIAGWGDNGNSLLLNSRYDIWRFDLKRKEAPICLTSDGISNHETVYRYIRTEPFKLFLRTRDNMILSTFNKKTKEGGYASILYNRPGKPAVLVSTNHKYTALERARKSEQLIWIREGFNEFPEVWTGLPSFKKPLMLSNLGREYVGFYHGKVSLVRWQAPDGRKYEGLLSVPENRSVDDKLPMIVTFYERHTDDMNRFRNYAPSRSVINTAQYLSHGYIVFEPDINYGTGTPGEDALNAVFSGTKHIISMGIVDSARIGIQGQSWGGYQVAYIITRTNIFAAAMAGAAVSNMTSAYNAIRWENGRARLFQYEEGQSRIGKTLWDNAGLNRYVENSPVFFADRITTPLLMMHNDNDGAVPWSQSIELYLALRRLKKPSWLLVYNNESHNLTRWPNRIDLNIRMKQFFDHYLKDAPAPVWMTSGRPAVIKGVDDCYRLND